MTKPIRLRPRPTIEPAIFALVLSLVVPPPSLLGQESTEAERELVYRKYLDFSSLVHGGVVEPRWLADGSRFQYTAGTPDSTIYLVDPVVNTKMPVVDPKPSSRPSDPAKSDAAHSGPRVVRSTRWMFDMLEIPAPSGQWLAHLRDHDVWLRDSRSDRLIQITSDGDEDFAWADDEQPWAWWSPDGSKLAVKKVDKRRVPKIPVGGLDPEPRIDWLPFPSVGEPLPRPELHLIDVKTKKGRRVELGGDPEKTLFVIGWRQDGSELLVAMVNRAHKHMNLLAVDEKTGQTRVVLTEERKTFYTPFWARRPVFIPLSNEGEFIWMSEMDGWYHLYRYDFDGNLINRLTNGSFPVHNVVTVDEEAGWLYYRAPGDVERPYDLHLYRVRLDGTRQTQLTQTPGIHEVRMSPSKRFFLDAHSSVDRPPRVELRAVDGELLRTLETADVSALSRMGWVPAEEFIAKADDDRTALHGVLYKPFDFDPARSYPVIEYVYDGPWTTLVPRTFAPGPGYPSAKEWYPLDQIDPRALAQLGFIVMVMDGQGTPERGKAFLDVRYRRSPDSVIAEHVEVLRELAEQRSYMDLERVGIFGISHGGYLTLRALLSAPDDYHVGVALAPAADLTDLMAAGVEPYRGLLEDDREGYANTSNLPLAANLAGELLIIHGTHDRIVPVSHTMRVVQALVEAGRRHDLTLLPGEDHLLTGESAIYARSVTRRFFQEQLQRLDR
jgi:dipeptidyl-peptidase-4